MESSGKLNIKYMNLTLTRVVFEFERYCKHSKGKWDLTLTRVVFESIFYCERAKDKSRFNFNKSCI